MNTVALISLCLVVLSTTEGFAPGVLQASKSKSLICRYGVEDDIERELLKARELLADTRVQLETMDEEEERRKQSPEKEEAPFFAKAAEDETEKIKDESSRRELFVKSKNKDGLITVKGDEMVKLSEEESWQARPLGEAFENELSEDEDVYSLATQQLAKSDVAARIWNLRRIMQDSDFRKVFDKRNRFIGDDM